MCPLSGLLQFFTLLVVLLLLCHHVVSEQWKLSLSENASTITMHQSKVFDFNVTGPDVNSLYLMVSSSNEHIAIPESREVIIKSDPLNKGFHIGKFTINGNFLGYATILLDLVEKPTEKALTSEKIGLTVIRENRTIDKIFVSSVATLVSIIYINFGCALNWGELKTNLRRPVGPAIGVIGQFLVMPLLSFGLGKVLFPDNPAMQLGMFFTGVSPGGGASNVWVAVLDGNIDLSITMTAISTFGAFGMMPLWIFTLGRVIFEQGDMEVPYSSIAKYAVALVVPLLIGYLIQRFLKRVARFLVRILKVFSSLLILFIVIFAIITNLYLFELFSWQIVVAGLGLPWLGYTLAYILAKVFRQSPEICLTIAVETGIQNTGIAIFLLRFALDQPEADLTTVVPVSVAIMTPFPLMFLFIYKKLKARCWTPKEKTQLLNGNASSEVDLEHSKIDTNGINPST